MDRFATMFRRLEGRKEGAFMAYWVIGDPDLEGFLKIVDTIVEGGADALELGLPSPDPALDGPVIRAAHQRALKASSEGLDARQILPVVRRRYPGLPVVLQGYAADFARIGGPELKEICRQAEIDAVLVVGPPAGVLAGADNNGPALPPLVPLMRVGDAPAVRDASSAGFVYAASHDGPTGIRPDSVAPPPEFFRKLKRHGLPPALLGFGISAPGHIRQALANGARGVVSGSVLVREMADETVPVNQRIARIGDCVATLKRATQA